MHSCNSVQPFSRNVDDKEISIAASRGLPELIQNVNRSSHGYSTPSLKISCKSVQPFSRNVADKEISIAASRGFSELTQNVMRSSRGHSTPSLKISCKSVQPFCLDRELFNVVKKFNPRNMFFFKFLPRDARSASAILLSYIVRPSVHP